MHGYHPWKGQEREKSSNAPGVDEWIKGLKEAREKAIEALTKAQESMKKYYDRKRVQKDGEAVYANFKEGSRVWLDGTNYKTIHPSKKLSAKRLGLFKVLERIGKSAYRLQLPASWRRVHPVFNEVVLDEHHDPIFASQRQPDPPEAIEVEGYPEYEVEEILEEKKRGKGSSYLVKWKGYGHEENTWEPKAISRMQRNCSRSFRGKNSPRKEILSGIDGYI